MAHLDRIATGFVIIAINSNPKEMACCVAWQPGSAGAGKKEQITLHFTFLLILLLIFQGKQLAVKDLVHFQVDQVIPKSVD